MPSIEEVILSGNKINSIADLKKGNFCFLANLSLRSYVYDQDGNKIVDFPMLTKSKLSKMQELKIEWGGVEEQSYNTSWIVQLETKKLEKLCTSYKI